MAEPAHRANIELPLHRETSDHLCGGKGPKFSKFHLQITTFHCFISVVKAVKPSEIGKFIFPEFYSLTSFIYWKETVLDFTVTAFRQRIADGILHKK